jgi:hypothetical protein
VTEVSTGLWVAFIVLRVQRGRRGGSMRRWLLECLECNLIPVLILCLSLRGLGAMVGIPEVERKCWNGVLSFDGALLISATV